MEKRKVAAAAAEAVEADIVNLPIWVGDLEYGALCVKICAGAFRRKIKTFRMRTRCGRHV